MITSLISQAFVRNTHFLAAVPGVQIAGKTGSSNFTEEEKTQYNIANGIKDSWFVGYSTELTTSVWTGYGDNTDGYIDTSSGSTEGLIARLLFKEIMTYAHTGRDAATFGQPDSVVRVGIQLNTRKIFGITISKGETIYEYYVKGTDPTNKSKDDNENSNTPSKDDKNSKDDKPGKGPKRN